MNTLTHPKRIHLYFDWALSTSLHSEHKPCLNTYLQRNPGLTPPHLHQTSSSVWQVCIHWLLEIKVKAPGLGMNYGIVNGLGFQAEQ